MPEGAPGERSGRPVIEVLAVAAGMVVFALFSHRGLPWILVGVGGFLLAAAAIERSLRSATHPAALCGLGGFSRKLILFAAVGCVIGAGFGLLYRNWQEMSLFPKGRLEAFAVVACLVGATEELVYRGWLQGRLRALGWPVAVVAAAAAHAAYKSALFAWPPGPMDIDLAGIGLLTAAGGMVFGLLREFSGSVVPAVLAHAAFDFLVYGALARAPWWVWT
jgi:membrane protease YdiL (CAAX protease family)